MKLLVLGHHLGLLDIHLLRLMHELISKVAVLISSFEVVEDIPVDFLAQASSL